MNIPYDLMKEYFAINPRDVTSTALLPRLRPMPLHPDDVAALAERLSSARAPVITAGRGAVRAGAGPAIAAPADRCGALLANTLPARGLLDEHPFSIGIAGGFASEIAVECFARADLVLVFGASLTNYTTDGGKLFGQAKVAHIDNQPLGLQHGRAAAEIHMRGDALLYAEALLQALPAAGAATLRTENLRVASVKVV